MATDADRLWEPFSLGEIELRNRVFVPGHTTNFGADNAPTRRHVAYHAERARGGAGLIVTEAIRVHPTSAGRHISLGSFDDSSIPAYAEMTEAVHAEGAKMFAQLMHAGRQANGDATRTAAWAPGDVPWAGGAHTPHAMGLSDIATIVDAFGAAARRMSRAGFDGLEVHLGHGHLLQQFLSPYSNTRSDAYGGDLDGRLRLTREVLAEVRERAPELPVGLRVSADEFLPGGLTPPDVVEIVARLRAEFPVLYVHVSHSAYHGSYSLATQMADMSFGHAPFRHNAALFKKEFPDLPVLAVCRLDSLAEAADLVASGEADLVGLARPHIADPHLVAKAMAGEADTTVSCLACNQGCVGRLEANLPISCVVNPEVGAEAEWNAVWASSPVPVRTTGAKRGSAEPALGGLEAAPQNCKVLVVGGGPAGMEAALAAHRAGHRVTLAEAGERLGGQIALAARVTGRERLGLLATEPAARLAAAGVTVLLGHRVGAADLLPGGGLAGFDEVIVATGSRPRRRELPGGPPVYDLWEAVAALADPDGARIGPLLGTVVIRDDEGGWPAASVAEHLARLGVRVHLVSPTATLAARITTYSKLALTHRLGELGVKAQPLRSVEGAEGDRVILRDTLNGDIEELTGVTAVIDAGRPIAVDDLYRALDGRPDAPSVHVAGDANAPRTALEAVYEGRLAGVFRTDPVTGAAALAKTG